jgi:hypothetical protein
MMMAEELKKKTHVQNLVWYTSMFGFSSGKKKKKNALNISLEIISIPFNI